MKDKELSDSWYEITDCIANALNMVTVLSMRSNVKDKPVQQERCKQVTDYLREAFYLSKEGYKD